MKVLSKTLNPQYIINETGKKTGVILDMITFEKLIEEIEDIYFSKVAKSTFENETEFITHEEVKQRIRSKK